MILRRLTIASRVAAAVAIPTLALVGALALGIGKAAERREAAFTELRYIDALEAITDVQANMHLVDLIEVRQAVEADETEVAPEQALLVGTTLDAAWMMYMPLYFAADDARADLGPDVVDLLDGSAGDALDQQRVVVDEIVAMVEAGEEVDGDALERLRSARLAADLALTDLALASSISAWPTYTATVEVSRATALEFGHLVPTLLGVRTVDVAELAILDGRRANATERVVYNLSAERRVAVQAIFDSADYTFWADARDDALAILAGDGEPWSLLEVKDFSDRSVGLGEAIDAVTLDVVADVRDDARARADAAAAQERGLAIAIIVIATVGGGSTLAILRSIRRPLRRLTQRTAEVAAGDLAGSPIPLGGRDELTDLGRVVEEVAEALTQLDQQVRAISDGRLDDPSLERVAPGLLGSFVADRVQQLRRASGALAEEANRDALTGLVNRRGLLAAINLLGEDAGGAVFFVDLDRFKSVNDDFGHRHGDAVLREVGARIQATARNGDISARLGGDEFVLVAIGLGEPEVAQGLARQLEVAVTQPITVDGVDHHIGCSIGVAWIDAAEEFGVTLERADLAMIGVKRRHRELARTSDRGVARGRRG